MIHSYSASFTALCRQCGRPEVDHTNLAQCEACDFTGECDIHGNMLLCPNCIAKEDIANQAASISEPYDSKRERMVFLLNSLEKGIAMDSRAYFVSRIDAIAEIEQRLIASGADDSTAKLQAVEIVSSMLEKMQERILASVKELNQMRTEVIADQRYLTMMVPQLREAEREKYKKFDISYRPSAAIPVASKAVATAIQKKSASDKALESQAKLLGVTIEQMRIINAKSVATALGAKCTCAETPGICKIHPKS